MNFDDVINSLISMFFIRRKRYIVRRYDKKKLSALMALKTCPPFLLCGGYFIMIQFTL